MWGGGGGHIQSELCNDVMNVHSSACMSLGLGLRFNCHSSVGFVLIVSSVGFVLIVTAVLASF